MVPQSVQIMLFFHSLGECLWCPTTIWGAENRPIEIRRPNYRASKKSWEMKKEPKERSLGPKWSQYATTWTPNHKFFAAYPKFKRWWKTYKQYICFCMCLDFRPKTLGRPTRQEIKPYFWCYFVKNISFHFACKEGQFNVVERMFNVDVIRHSNSTWQPCYILHHKSCQMQSSNYVRIFYRIK